MFAYIRSTRRIGGARTLSVALFMALVSGRGLIAADEDLVAQGREAGFHDPTELIEQHAPAFTERLDLVEAQLSEAVDFLESDLRRAGRLVLAGSSRLEGVRFESVLAFYQRQGETEPATLASLEERRLSLQRFASDLEEEILSRTSPYLRGDADGDLRIEARDAILVLEFLLAGGPAPACFAGADATADGALDMTDAIVSLELLVRGVSPPESRLFVELEEPRNAGCPWSRITPERQRKTEDCPNGCEPILPPRSRCGWYKEALFDLYCFRSWCIWVPTCEWVYCCYVCADTC